jgi:hypothetical protein
MQYRINVAKRYGIGTDWKGQDEYRHLFKVETDYITVDEILDDFALIYPFPEYLINTYREEQHSYKAEGKRNDART